MADNDFEQLLETSMQELMAKQEGLQRDFGLGDMARWWLDQPSGTIQFFDEQDRLAVEAQILNIGSFAPRTDTWKWAWSNPTVEPGLREKALQLKALEGITGIALFSSEEAFPVGDEGMAWELAAIAVHHLKAVGCYRAPSGNDGPVVYLALTSINRVNYQ